MTTTTRSKADILSILISERKYLREIHQDIVEKIRANLNNPYSIPIWPDNTMFYYTPDLITLCNKMDVVQKDIAILTEMINSVETGEKIPLDRISQYFENPHGEYRSVWIHIVGMYLNYFYNDAREQKET